MIMRPTGHNKWGKCMNVNKDREVIRRQPNSIRYLNGRLNVILGWKIQTSLSWEEKKIMLILYSSTVRNT